MPSVDSIYVEEYFGGEKFGSYVDYEEDKKAMVKTFQQYLALLHKTSPKAKRLLDIGAATGFFVNQASESGYEAEGIEISQTICGEAQKMGRRVRQGTLGFLAESTLLQSFDIVTMWDVIEHLPDLSKCFIELKRLLPAGGILLVNTPDAGSLWARLFSTKWHSIVPPEHVLWFNKKNLTLFLEQQGFEVLLTRTSYKKFTLQYIVNMLYRWQKLRVWKYIGGVLNRSFLGRLAIPLPLGDNMIILARRVK